MMRKFLLPYIESHAKSYPDKPAFTVPNQGSLSYSQLFELTSYWNHVLQDLDFPIATRIGVLDVDVFTVATLGSAIVSRHTFVGIDHNIGMDAILDYVDLMHIDVIITESCSKYQSLIDSSSLTWIDVSNNKITCVKKGKIQPYSFSDDIVGMIKTSGTTSTPKVIPVSEDMLVSQFDMYYKQFEVSQDDVFAQPVNMSRPISFLLQTIRCFRWGNTLVYTALDSIQVTFNHINEYKITRYTAPTFLIHALNEYLIQNELSLLHNIVIVNLGSPLQPIHVSNLKLNPMIKLVNSYGMSETGLLTSTYRQIHEDIFSAGIDLGVNIEIINDEICVGFPNYFQGYENFNEDVFINGYFRTGDNGYFDVYGNLHIIGRVKEMINRGGDKISPYEVESHIIECFDVIDVAVFPIPSFQWSQEVGCVIVSYQSITLPQLREALKTKISSFKMPSVLYAMPKIPRSANGKINRNSLHEDCTSEYQVHHVSGRVIMTPTQHIIHDCWCEVLELPSLGIEDDFISFGGDSFRFAQLWTLIQEKTHQYLDIAKLSQANTIRKQAELIDTKPTQVDDGLIVLKEGNSAKTPIIFVHDVAGTCEAYVNLLKYDYDDHPIYGLNLNESLFKKVHITDVNRLVKIYSSYIKSKGFTKLYIGGISSGGLFAYECARALNNDVEVKGIFMIDTFIHLHDQFKSKWGRMKALTRKHWRNLRSASIMHSIKLIPQLIVKGLKRGYSLNVVEDQLNKDVQNYLKNHTTLQKQHIQSFIRKIIEGWTPLKCSVDVLYFYASNKHNPHHSYKILEHEVRTLKLIIEDTHHSGFVSESLAIKTASELKTFIQEKEV
jgi:oxalate---CoA ligase